MDIELVSQSGLQSSVSYRHSLIPVLSHLFASLANCFTASVAGTAHYNNIDASKSSCKSVSGCVFQTLATLANWWYPLTSIHRSTHASSSLKLKSTKIPLNAHHCGTQAKPDTVEQHTNNNNKQTPPRQHTTHTTSPRIYTDKHARPLIGIVRLTNHRFNLVGS